jgi:NAD(P) transhydrogenase subunit alpha
MAKDIENIIVGVPRETFPEEKRVALVPEIAADLKKRGLEVCVEKDAGLAAGIPDSHFEAKGARIIATRDELFRAANVILQVRTHGANIEAGAEDVGRMSSGQVVIGLTDPLSNPEQSAKMAERGVFLFSLELIPRITRAQNMDVLSSMATVAGYKAVLMASAALPRMFPMLMTAAGTIAPARVFVVGAGVAGLQAIATARRLGAVVSSYDVRPDVKEQVESLGAKFIEIDLDAGEAEDKGGYAKEMGEEFYKKQREMMLKIIAGSDVVITTAAVPGKKAPILITEEMVKTMDPGSVIVDIAAERGGNCEITRPGEDVVLNGISILGPTNLPATVPYHASRMYAKNVQTFLLNMIKEGSMEINMDDEIVRDTLVAKGGQVIHPRVRDLLGLETTDSDNERNQ